MPLRSAGSLSFPRRFDTSFPFANVASENSPSRTERTVNSSESAFTAFVPTPFIPTENWNASVLNLPPVFSSETQSTTFPRGIPRP